MFPARRMHPLASLFVAGAWVAPPAFAGEDWNQWLGGPERSSATNRIRRSTTTHPVQPRELWRRRIGAGYSAVALHGDRLVSMMNDGDADYVISLDAKTGRERWRFRIGPKYPGHAGSLDGPRSTPAMDERFVYGLGPRGNLVCLDAERGELRWEIDLKRTFGASETIYGFTTSPLLEADRLIVQAGSAQPAKGASLVALDRRTGQTLWRAGSDPTEHTSPCAATFFGVRQVIAQSARRVFAVRIEDGTLLWDVPISAGGFWTPLPAGPDRLFVSAGVQSMMIRLTRREGRIEPRIVWTTPRMGGVINAFVYHEPTDTIIGANSVNSRRLTALDAGTGKLRWIQRRDASPLLAGDYLIVLSDRQGMLFVGTPTADGYAPIAEHTLYETRPTLRIESPLAFAGGILYVRTPAELIALRF